MKRLPEPSKLENYYIQKFAIELLTQSSLNKKEWDIIVKLLRYQEKNSVAEKWLFVVEIYEELGNLKSEMAKNILILFSRSFKKNLLTILFEDSPEIEDMTTTNSGSGHVAFSSGYIATQMRSTIYEYCYYHDMNQHLESKKDINNEHLRYYEILKIFVKNQIDCINDSNAPKSIELQSIAEKIKQNKNCFEELKNLVPEIRKICNQHRDEGLKGFLKFNFLRPPRSREVLDSIFDGDSELSPELGTTAKT